MRNNKTKVLKISLVAIVLALILGVSMILVACAPKKTQVKNDKPVVVVTTSFINDMLKNILGDKYNNFDVQQLLSNDADPHTAELTTDMKEKINKAAADTKKAIILYHGLGFEHNLLSLLQEKTNAYALDTNFTKAAEPKADTKRGEVRFGKFDHEALEADPHFWFDLDLYKQAVNLVSEKVSALDSTNKDLYSKNTMEYNAKLDNLDKEIKTKVDEIKAKNNNKMILVTVHDAFGYLARNYGFDVVAPQGISTEAEASSENVDETVKTIVENNIPAIFSEATSNKENVAKLKDLVKKAGKEVIVVGVDKGTENEELLADALASEGEASTFIGMVKHNLDLISKYLNPKK